MTRRSKAVGDFHVPILITSTGQELERTDFGTACSIPRGIGDAHGVGWDRFLCDAAAVPESVEKGKTHQPTQNDDSHLFSRGFFHRLCRATRVPESPEWGGGRRGPECLIPQDDVCIMSEVGATLGVQRLRGGDAAVRRRMSQQSSLSWIPSQSSATGHGRAESRGPAPGTRERSVPLQNAVGFSSELQSAAREQFTISFSCCGLSVVEPSRLHGGPRRGIGNGKRGLGLVVHGDRFRPANGPHGGAGGRRPRMGDWTGASVANARGGWRRSSGV